MQIKSNKRFPIISYVIHFNEFIYFTVIRKKFVELYLNTENIRIIYYPEIHNTAVFCCRLTLFKACDEYGMDDIH